MLFRSRADMVVAGCAILEAILDIWPADRLGVADRGIREGILRGLMAADAEGFAATLPKTSADIRLLGTSGTVTTLASVHLALPSYDRRAVDGLQVPVGDMRRISTMIAELDLSGRSALPCIGTERADMVVAGCAILEAILDIWPATTLGIADRGIREGILRSLMARDGFEL